MLSPDSRESTIERFTGALTAALGIGASIPRPGLGFYSVLEADGNRIVWSLGLLFFGTWMFVLSYFGGPKLRLIVMILAIVVWGFLIKKFIMAGLWGACLQGVAVASFSGASAFRIGREFWRKD